MSPTCRVIHPSAIGHVAMRSRPASQYVCRIRIFLDPRFLWRRLRSASRHHDDAFHHRTAMWAGPGRSAAVISLGSQVTCWSSTPTAGDGGWPSDGRQALVSVMCPYVEHTSPADLGPRCWRWASRTTEREDDMAVRIRSLVTSGPVLVPLSSGTTLRLSPGQVSDDLPDVEVANNAKVGKLQRQGMIDVATAKEVRGRRRADEPASRRAGRRATGRRASSPAAGAQGGPGGKSRAQPGK